MNIVHGDNQTASRLFYLDLKKIARSKSAEIIDLDGQNLTVEILVTALSSANLFQTGTELFVEGFFSRRPGKTKDEVISYLKSNPGASLNFWDGKDISLLIREITGVKPAKFDQPKSLYNFLDTLEVPALNSALRQIPPEQILPGLVRQMHDLFLVFSGSNRLPDWKARKLRLLLARFPASGLEVFYRRLLAIDYNQKTSNTAFDLGSALQVWTTELHSQFKKV